MNDNTVDIANFEECLNALIDGELGELEHQSLLDAAADSPQLGTRLAQALKLQQALQAIPMEKAPAKLTRNLRKIPTQHRAPRSPWLLQPRWAIAAGLLALLFATTLYLPGNSQTELEVAQGRQDLALALAYLDNANRSTNSRVRSTLNDHMLMPVTEHTSRALQRQL